MCIFRYVCMFVCMCVCANICLHICMRSELPSYIPMCLNLCIPVLKATINLRVPRIPMQKDWKTEISLPYQCQPRSHTQPLSSRCLKKFAPGCAARERDRERGWRGNVGKGKEREKRRKMVRAEKGERKRDKEMI